MASSLLALDVVTLVVSLAFTVAAGLLTLPLWRREERLRDVLSILLFLRSRRRIALAGLLALIVAFAAASLLGTVDDLLGIPAAVSEASVDVLYLVGSLSLFLLAYLGLGERPITAEERQALRSGQYRVFRFLDDLSSPGERDWPESPVHPLVPPAPEPQGGAPRRPPPGPGQPE